MNWNEKSKTALNVEMTFYRAVAKYSVREHKHNVELERDMGIVDIIRA